MKNKTIRKIKNNKGSTMIETILSFVVLMIVFATLFGMVRFSSNLRMRAVDTANVKTEFNEQIYKKDTSSMTNITVHEYVGKHADDRFTMFMLQPDVNKTSATNLQVGITDVNNVNPNLKNNIRIPNIDAKGFVSSDSRIVEEKLVTPRVLRFEFNQNLLD